MLDDYFKTTDYKNLKLTPEQGTLINKEIQFVKGSDFYKNYYDSNDKNVIEKLGVRYYQIAMFEELGKYAIRSYLLEGSNSKGACFYNYKMKEIKEYKIDKKKLDKFVLFLDKEKKKNNKIFKLMYKFHPVYNFNFTNPPTGNDINECVSELIN